MYARMKLKVMTFNMQHGLDYLKYKSLPKNEKYDCIDLDVMADAIRKCDPDIVGLNEVRGYTPAIARKTRAARRCSLRRRSVRC